MTSDPKRLTVVGATDLERSLLQAARRERPSPEMTARMAAGLGISVGAALTVAAPVASAASVPAAAAPVVAAKTTLGVWLAAGIVVGAVSAGVVGVRFSAKPEPPAVHAVKPAAPAVARPEPEAPIAAPAVAASDTRVERVEKIRRRPVATPPAAPASAATSAGDLRDQIALIDAARGAVKGGAFERALVLLRRYDASYPAGAFRPEAAALRIEALDQDGHGAEARALARDFLARYPQSPVAARIARIAAK